MARWLAVVVVMACGKDAATPPASTSGEPAGKVVALEGEASARRPAAELRKLAIEAPVWADDTVTVASGASLRVLLRHNDVTWAIEGGEGGVSRKVSESVAWRAPRGASEGSVAEKDRTASAGRHTEGEAAGTASTAVKGEAGEKTAKEEAAPAQGPPPPPSPPPPPPPETRAHAAKREPPAAVASPPPQPTTPPPPVAAASPPTPTPPPAAPAAPEPAKPDAPTLSDKSGGGPRPAVTAEPTVSVVLVTGDAKLRRALSPHTGAVKACVESAHKEAPLVSGSFTLMFFVEKDGRVSRAGVSGANARRVSECVSGAAQGWTLPATLGGKGRSVVYTIKL